MDKIQERQIVTLNLKYSSAAKPLKTLAFAHLSAKALYLLNKPSTVTDIQKALANIIDVRSVDQESVKRGLDYLQELGQARHMKSEWSLTDATRTAIDGELAGSARQLDGVLDRHFANSIDRATLRSWFLEASAAIFGHFGDDWVASVCRVEKKPKYRLVTLADHIKPSAKKYRLETQIDSLARGYRDFLESEDIEDRNRLMALGQAMFSARLVAADIGAEPITVREFKDATLFIDTNVLFAVALEDHRLASSVAALGRALKQIGVVPVYARDTMDEYGRALEHKRSTVLNAVRNFPKDVVNEVDDDFIGTALSRQCRTVEDYERFFDQLVVMPDRICDGLELQLLEDELIQKATDEGHADEKLKTQLQSFARRLRPAERGIKGRRSLEHDAALIHIVEAERQRGNNCWIMSIDRSLRVCAVDMAGPHEMPAVVGVDAMIEVLAVNASGPELDASEFAPLLARIILMDCQPPANAYRLTDLEWLHEINERVASLPPDETKKIVRHVARARASGKTVNSTDLQLEVNRMFQQERRDKEVALQTALDRSKSAEQLAADEKAEKERLQGLLIDGKQKELERSARSRLVLSLLWRVPVTVAVGAALWLASRYLVPKGDKRDAINYAIAILGYALSVLGLPSVPILVRQEVNVNVRAC